MIRLLDRMFAQGRSLAQRGMTGTETAIVIASGAAVVATMAATLYASSLGSGETVYADLDQASSGLEPRGAVIGLTGTLPDGEAAVYRVSFVIAGAPDAEPVDLRGSFTADGAGLDPDITGDGSETPGITVNYRSGGLVVEDAPWTVDFLGFSDGDSLLEVDEKAQLSVWLLDRDGKFDVGEAGSVTPREDSSALLPPLGAGDEFTIEVESQLGGMLQVTRVVPQQLEPVVDMK